MARKSDLAYSELRRLILLAELAPGDVIDESALIETLGIGRTPLREAVLRLSQEGLVTGIGRRGYMVSAFTPSDVFHAFELRREIECFAAAKAADRRSEEQLADLNAFLTRIKGEMHQWADDEIWNLRADEEFHMRVAAASRNSFAERQIRDLFALSVRSLFAARLPVTLVRDEFTIYLRVHDAIARRDGSAAARAMGEHLTVNPLRQFFEPVPPTERARI